MAGEAAVDALLRRAVSRHQAGDLDGAEEGYRAAAALAPGNPHPLHYLGLIALARGDAEGACQAIERAIAVEPTVPEFHVNLGNARKRLGMLPAAAKAYEQALILRPGFLAASLNLAALRERQSDLRAALAILQSACRDHPRDSAPLCAMSRVLRRAGRWRDALACSKAATEAPNADVVAFALHGELLMVLDDWQEADRTLRRAVRRFPGSAELLAALGCAQDGLGQLVEATRSFRAAIEAQSTYMPAWANLAAVLRHQGRVDDALAAYDRARALSPDDAGLHSAWLFTALMSDRFAVSAIVDAHRAFAQRAAHVRPAPPASSSAGRRLRIGYLSADLRRHPVGYFLAGVIAKHDPATFEVTCYHVGCIEDDLSVRMRAEVCAWVNGAHLTDDELVAKIRSDGIDILVDLSGHTAGSRLVMLAARPAPVQVSYLGYAHPLYLPWIDARISDLQADPPGASCAGGEAVYRLPTGYSYYCYAPPAGMPEVSSLPAKTRGYLTFGAFLQLGKLTPATVELWAGVLLAVPTSRLLIRAKGLGDKAVRDQVASALAGFGIARNRLQLEGWRSHDAHLRGYHEVDCMLDTTPFNLATNTCEALWMGVPTISLAGDRLSSRMGASILGAAGLADWVADDEDAFVKIACRAAGDLPWLAELRAGMRSQVAQSPLVDAEGYTRALEAIYRSLQGVAEARLSGGS